MAEVYTEFTINISNWSKSDTELIDVIHNYGIEGYPEIETIPANIGGGYGIRRVRQGVYVFWDKEACMFLNYPYFGDECTVKNMVLGLSCACPDAAISAEAVEHNMSDGVTSKGKYTCRNGNVTEEISSINIEE